MTSVGGRLVVVPPRRCHDSASISEVVLVPAYSEGDLCAATARLVLIVPHSCWAVEPEVTVPAELASG